MSNRLVLPALPARLHEVMLDAHRYRCVNGPRQMGKDYLGCAVAFDWAWRGGRIWWVSNVYSNSEGSFATAKRLLSTVDVARIREGDRSITFPSGGSITFKTADAPQNLRGATLDGAVLNEWAFADPTGEVWNVLSPALAVKRAPVLFLSTANGVGDPWHRMVQRGDPRHPSHDPDWHSWQFTHLDNEFVTPFELEKIRRGMPELRFRQEACGEFLSGGGARIDRTWIREDKPPARMSIAMGVDLAASQRDSADWTACAVLGRTDDGRTFVLDVQRVRASFADVIAFVQRMADTWKPSVIGVESFGFQQVAVQELLRVTSLNVRAVALKGDKVAKFSPLEARYQQGQVFHAPRLRTEFVDELVSFPEGQHDDMVDACAIAWHVLSDGVQFISPATLERAAPTVVPDLEDALFNVGVAVGRATDVAAVTVLARPLVVDKYARPDSAPSYGPPHVLLSVTSNRARSRVLVRKVLDLIGDAERIDVDGEDIYAQWYLDEFSDETHVHSLDASTRADLAQRLFRYLQGGRPVFAPIAEGDAAALKADVSALQRNVSAAGNVDFSGDARAWSLALALRGIDEPELPRGLGQDVLFTF